MRSIVEHILVNEPGFKPLAEDRFVHWNVL